MKELDYKEKDVLARIENDKKRTEFYLDGAKKDGEESQSWVPLLFGVSILMGAGLMFLIFKSVF